MAKAKTNAADAPPADLPEGEGPEAEVPEDRDRPEGEGPEAFTYRCTEACTFMKRYRGAGDLVILPEKKDIPHFELIA
jgi:hypothetical protein